ncbi:hypothetical protein QE152_g15715 [Popillia japonica]|uniref:Uncharacterized protein n=1 Tax=Popillia japonica TaxID=7064 RepID=A0AAW1L4Q4_POPJA
MLHVSLQNDKNNVLSSISANYRIPISESDQTLRNYVIKSSNHIRTSKRGRVCFTCLVWCFLSYSVPVLNIIIRGNFCQNG